MANKFNRISALLLVLLLITGLSFLSFSKSRADGHYLAAGPKITFTTMNHDFGSFPYGEIVYTRFPFRNTGTAPLVISEVERPCGCLLPIWTKNPVMPGDTGSIQVYYSSKQRPGVFRKTMVVYTNILTKDDIIIMVQGNADKKLKKKKK
jgi:hypothetical protein